MPQSTAKPLGEFDFIRRHLTTAQPADPELLLGIGDDAAIVRPRPGHDLCFSSDMLLAGRHFFPDVAPADLAHKILAVNISDMAAMGARPRWVMLSAALPELNPGWLEAFSGSLFAMLRRYGITLIGGDTTKGNLVFNVAITGELPAGLGLRRSGAQNGDDIWVSGQIGLAAAALHHIWQNIRLPETAAHQRQRTAPYPFRIRPLWLNKNPPSAPLSPGCCVAPPVCSASASAAASPRLPPVLSALCPPCPSPPR